MALRPLSQSGLRRIAKNALQRPILEGGMPAQRTVLEAFNDRQTDGFLHPTKGWRHLSATRSIAAMITAEMQRGQRGYDTETIRKALVSV